MYCPQCGTESSSGQQYCRSCGSNLKVIGKALTLSEAIARSDRGPLPRIKELVKNLKVEHVTEEVSRALDRVNKEIVRSSTGNRSGRLWWRKKKTAEERREDHIVKGTVSLFSGVGLTIFLYYFTAALVLRLPPVWIDQVPFEIEPVVRILWLLGLVPMLSGAGHILAGLLIRPTATPAVDSSWAFADGSRSFEETERIEPTPGSLANAHDGSSAHQVPSSVTEHTTNLLK
jgi:hypothetical protein